MAVHKAIRSNPAAQLQRRPDFQPKDPQPNDLQLKALAKDPQLKSELFEALRHLNRGFGVALSSLDSLQRKRTFPRDLLLSYRNRTEELRALANRDLLRWITGNEEQEAERFGLLCGTRKRMRRS